MNPSTLSYTSANALPAKLLHPRVYGVLKLKFEPMHVQLCLTNKCQLSCSYCSCGKRDRKQEASRGRLDRDLSALYHAGMDAVTITGGGEPLLYPELDRVLLGLTKNRAKIGLVTNGIGLKAWPMDIYKVLSWIRISFDSDRRELPDIDPLAETQGIVKPAFSYVYRKGDEKDQNLWTLYQWAKNRRLTHLRIVTDILHPPEFIDNSVRQIRTDNVILQDRRSYREGARKCWISLIKPVVDVDGTVYPCCGAQYALDDDSHLFPPDMAMGNVQEYLDHHVQPQTPFDGSKCKKCYYHQYNELLDILKSVDDLEDVPFV
jgi:MoaA/NifB/PqqE/SkfB family radical SAM enzyme